MSHYSIQQESMAFRLYVWQTHHDIPQLFSAYELAILKYKVKVSNTWHRLDVGPKVSANSYRCTVGAVIERG